MSFLFANEEGKLGEHPGGLESRFELHLSQSKALSINPEENHEYRISNG